VGIVIIIATEEQHRMEMKHLKTRDRKNISKTKGMHRNMTHQHCMCIVVVAKAIKHTYSRN
jgi:hypothetical protein